jgi:hypothetical protein
MHSDRKHERKQLSYPGWILVEGCPLHQCVIEDVSDGGARLLVDDVSAIPDRFRLLMSPTARTYRECRVCWRRPGPRRIGLQFVKKSATASQCVTVE